MKKILAFCLAVCMCLSMAACNGEGAATTGTTVAEDVLYTVRISINEGHFPVNLDPDDIKYYVYRNANKDGGIAAYGTLTESMEFLFTAPKSDTYTLVLEGLPEGYAVQESYTLKEPTTQIDIRSGVIMGQELIQVDSRGKIIAYNLGDMMRDFTVTDTDGNTFTVSEMLKTKKAVVLNFWNIKCDPCKMEFPHLQKAYEEYQDDIALIALDPVAGDTEAKVAAFKEEFGLTFPMAPVPDTWQWAFAQFGNPTTIIIDRYGMICVVECGSMPAGIFEKVFAHFVAEDYEQTLIRSMQLFAAENKEESN